MTRRFQCAGLAISVDASAADLEWLEEFFGPALMADAADEEHGRSLVHVTVSPPTRLPGTTDGLIDGRIAHVLDSGVLRLRERMAGGTIYLYDTNDALACFVSADALTASVVDGPDHRVTRIRLMRVVREYAHNHAIQMGGLMLHAAAIGTAAGVIALAGPKGVGKTTLALRLLASGERRHYLSNDRLLVRVEDGVQAFAVPTVIAVRPGTRQLMPELTACLEWAGDFLLNTRERRAQGPRPPETTGDTWHVSSEQLCRCLGAGRRRTGPLAFVLFPRRASLQRATVRVMDVEEAAAALADAIVGRQYAYASEVFTAQPPVLPDGSAMVARARTLAARVRCIDGYLPDHATSAETNAWLAECLQAAR